MSAGVLIEKVSPRWYRQKMSPKKNNKVFTNDSQWKTNKQTDPNQNHLSSSISNNFNTPASLNYRIFPDSVAISYVHSFISQRK